MKAFEKRKPVLKLLTLAAYLGVYLVALRQLPPEVRPLYGHLLYGFVAMGGFLFRLPGGLAASAAASLIALTLLLGAGGMPEMGLTMEAAVPVGSFFLVGLVAGGLSSRMRRLRGDLERTNEGLESEVRRRTRELRRINEELRLASSAKSEFLRNASHEFKTPLNAIIGFADLVLEGLYGPLSAEQTEAVQGILDNAEHLLVQVTNLLEMSRLETGSLQLAVDEVVLHDLISEVVAANRSLLRDGKVEVLQELDKSVPSLRTDRNRLRGVLQNLFSNAVKFTDEGYVRIATHNMPMTGEVEIAFEDTGIGIEPEDRERIFEKFVQADTSASRRHEGTGIGLAIVHKTLTRLGGKVSVDSEPGKGSTFRVVLPHTLRQPASVRAAAAVGG